MTEEGLECFHVSHLAVSCCFSYDYDFSVPVIVPIVDIVVTSVGCSARLREPLGNGASPFQSLAFGRIRR
jgi:hypothetical protein